MLEAEVQVLKKSIGAQPDLSVDEKNWRTVRPAAKKSRARTYKARYA